MKNVFKGWFKNFTGVLLFFALIFPASLQFSFYSKVAQALSKHELSWILICTSDGLVYINIETGEKKNVDQGKDHKTDSSGCHASCLAFYAGADNANIKSIRYIYYVVSKNLNFQYVYAGNEVSVIKSRSPPV